MSVSFIRAICASISRRATLVEKWRTFCLKLIKGNLFSAKPINESQTTAVEEPTKKAVRKTRAKPTIRATTARLKTNPASELAIDKQLTYIYKDKNGNLPDMKNIKIKKTHSGLKFFFIFLLIGGLLAGSAWAGFFLLPGNKKFSEDQIELAINGPKEVTAGVTTTYSIVYKNNLGINLENATLNLQYPEGFTFISSEPQANNTGHTEWPLGSLPPYKKREVIIIGTNYGVLNQVKSFREFFTYKPENMASELQKTITFNTSVNDTPYSLSISGPDKIALGNMADYTFILKKEMDSQINKLEIQPNFPPEFMAVSSSPKLNKDSKWIFDTAKLSTSSARQSEWTFKVSGKFSSSTGQSIPLTGTLSAITTGGAYKLADAKIDSELTQSNLDFHLIVNGSMANQSSKPDEMLTIALYIKNANLSQMQNAIVKLNLDAPSYERKSILDWSKINDKYDADIRGIQVNDTTRRGEMIWTKTKITELANIEKGKELTIEISLPIKDASTFDITELKDYKITANAEVTFTEKNGSRSVSSNPIEIILNSNLKFETRDAVSDSKHEITWVLNNDFHPLKNLVLSADVYGNPDWQGPSPVPAGELTYDKTAQKITWNIPEMPIETDVLALPFTLTLNEVNPTQEVLVSKIRVQAEDSVTGEKIEFMGDETPLK